MNNIILRYFTLHLRNVLEQSQIYARAKKNNDKVQIIDIFKAVAQEKGSVGYNILRNLTVLKKTNEKLLSTGEKKKKVIKSQLPFSESAHKVIINAIRAAQEFRFSYVGTEHLLFAILESGDQEIFSILGKDKNELKRLIEQLKKAMTKTTDSIEEPLFYINYPKKQQEKNSPLENEEAGNQEFIQEVMGEMSELLSSLLTKKKKQFNEVPKPGFFPQQPMRPSFGIVMPQMDKPEKFLEYFGRDMNKETIQGKLDPVVGRDKEVDDLICILMRRSKNNPVLVGEPGVGKTAIVAGLARKIVEKEVPPILVGKRIVSLDLGLLVAGTSFRGEFEDRFKRVLEEAENDPSIILFIDELHNLVGAGSAQGSLDAANIIKPALARGLLRCVGATTVEEYHRYIEKDGALERRFQPVWVKEPNVKETVKVLKGIRRHYEDYHNVKISDRAIAETVKLANRYMTDRFLPDKAIDLLDESAAFVVQDEHRQGTTKKLQKLQTQREKIHRLKEKMVQNDKMDMAANLLKSEKELLKIIKELEKRVAAERQFIPVVDERDVAEVLARKLNLPLELVMESSAKRLSELPLALKRSIRGQEDVVKEVSATLKRSLAGIADPERPATAFLFVGPTGVGKTYLAKLLAKELFLKSDALIRVDMSEFNEKHTVSRLLGSPPGYVGYGETNSFTDKIRKNPYSLVLFDEIEKAHPEVFHILLQVLEDGFLTDGAGRKINFRNSIIVFTSNLGNDEFLKQAMGFSFSEDTTGEEKIDQLLQKVGKREKNMVRRKLEEFLRPEFLNRLSNIVFFKPLGFKEIKEIALLEINKLKRRLLAIKKIKLDIDKELIDILAKKCVDKKEGVRIVRRLIQRKFEEPIAHNLLSGKIEKGASIKFGLDKKSGKKFKMKVMSASKPKVYEDKNVESVYARHEIGVKK